MCALRSRISDSLSLLGLVCECYAIRRVVEGNGASGLEMMEWHILSRIPRLGIADQCGVMIERVMKCE